MTSCLLQKGPHFLVRRVITAKELNIPEHPSYSDFNTSWSVMNIFKGWTKDIGIGPDNATDRRTDNVKPIQPCNLVRMWE